MPLYKEERSTGGQMTDGITYTFPASVDPRLAGRTYTNGKIAVVNGAQVVDFGVRAGVRVCAKISGRPELEAALAAHNAAIAKREQVLKEISWAEYERIQGDAINARGAYDAASEHGYPTREAAAMARADGELELVGKRLPRAKAYALAIGYVQAANYAKSAAGSRAVERIESGEDAIKVVADMQAQWSEAASRAVLND